MQIEALRVSAALAVAGAAGCAFELGAPEEELGQVEQSATTVAAADFESSSPGALGSPWTITTAGGSSATVVASAGHGNVFRLRGSKVLGGYLIASLRLSSSSTEIASQADLAADGGAAFVWSLHGAGSSIGRRRIRLQQAPGTTTLVASTVPAGNVACASVPAGAWSTVTLRVHAAAWPHTFDVLVNGRATACTGLETGLGPPFNAVSLMDASNQGWGGDVRLDNVRVTTP